jgi:hypothetical protein
VKVEPEPAQPEKVEPETPPAKKEPPPPPTKAPAPAPVAPPVRKEPAPPPPAKKEPEPAHPVKREPEAPPVKIEAPPPVLAPQVGRQGEEQLRRTANSSIQRTEHLIGQLEGKKLTGEQQEQLLTVRSLLGNAREALLAQDLTKASNLADKARILAEELAQSVK